MGSAKALLELENRPFTAHSTRWAITRRIRATGLTVTQLAERTINCVFHGVKGLGIMWSASGMAKLGTWQLPADLAIDGGWKICGISHCSPLHTRNIHTEMIGIFELKI
jgi:hypothetical protein